MGLEPPTGCLVPRADLLVTDELRTAARKDGVGARSTRARPRSAGLASWFRIVQPKLGAATYIIFTLTACSPGQDYTRVSRRPGLVVTAEHDIESAPAGCKVALTVRFAGTLESLVGVTPGRLTRQYLALEAAGLNAACEAV